MIRIDIDYNNQYKTIWPYFESNKDQTEFFMRMMISIPLSLSLWIKGTINHLWQVINVNYIIKFALRIKI